MVQGSIPVSALGPRLSGRIELVSLRQGLNHEDSPAHHSLCYGSDAAVSIQCGSLQSIIEITQNHEKVLLILLQIG